MGSPKRKTFVTAGVPVFPVGAKIKILIFSWQINFVNYFLSSSTKDPPLLGGYITE
jgi:hypothetical protein